MSQHQPLVSIIMPCFNGMPYLDAAISSVRAQLYSNWQLLVVDNGSTDQSKECALNHSVLDQRIQLLNCVNRGASSARNLGIRQADGRYIAFLDCDDLWEPHKLTAQIGSMAAAGAGFSWAGYQVIDDSGNILREQQVARTINYHSFMAKDSVIGCLTVVFDCTLLGKSYMPPLRMRQDYALWAELIDRCEHRGIPMVGIPEVLAKYRIHATAMTRNKMKAAYFQWKLYREARRHSIGLSTRYFFKYLKNAVKDRI